MHYSIDRQLAQATHRVSGTFTCFKAAFLSSANFSALCLCPNKLANAYLKASTCVYGSHCSDLFPIFVPVTGLTTLELSEVRGVTDVGLKALGNLARLERLVVALDSAASCSSPMVMEQRPGDMLQQLDGMGSSHGYDDLSNSSGSVTHASIESLAACGQLKHIEWSVGAGFSSYQMEHYVVPVIRKLIGLQYLCLNVKRSAAASVGASMSRSDSQGAAFLRAAVNGREGSGASASSTGGLGDGQYMYAWRAELMMALPLCQVADMASMAYYSVWDDCVIHGDE